MSFGSLPGVAATSADMMVVVGDNLQVAVKPGHVHILGTSSHGPPTLPTLRSEMSSGDCQVIPQQALWEACAT